MSTLERSSRPGEAAAAPPAPWRLAGPALLATCPVSLERARALPHPAGLRLVALWPGTTVGGILLASYGRRATMPYDELIVFSALARHGRRVGMCVSHIYVDSEASLAGGRTIWGLPKELAEFRRERSESTTRVTVTAADGRRLLEADHREPGLRPPLPLLAPVFGSSAGDLRHARGRGRLYGGPVRPRLAIPPQAPFASLGLSRARLGLAGELDLLFPGAGVLRAPAPGAARTATAG